MTRPRRRFLKLTIGAELRRQLVTSVRVRRGPYGDIVDFPYVVRKAHSVRPIGVGIGDKAYDSEESHELLRDELHAMSMIPPRMEKVPLWRTEGLYRKEMKRRFSERVYHQRSKDETIFSVVKRTMGDEMRSAEGFYRASLSRSPKLESEATPIDLALTSTRRSGARRSRCSAYARVTKIKKGSG